MNTEYNDKLEAVKTAIEQLELYLEEHPEKRVIVFAKLHDVGQQLAAQIRLATHPGVRHLVIAFDEMAKADISFASLKEAIVRTTISANELSCLAHPIEFEKVVIQVEELQKFGEDMTAKSKTLKPAWKKGRNNALNRIICKGAYT